MTRPLSRRSLLKLLAASGVSLLGLSTPVRQAAAQRHRGVERTGEMAYELVMADLGFRR